MARRRGKGESANPPHPPEPSTSEVPWRVRFAERILAEDLKKIGHAALELAGSDRQKAVEPERYGQRRHSPLHGLYEMKASHVGIAYHVEKARREVWVLMIGDRRDIWDEDQAEILERLQGVQRQVDQDSAS